MGCDSYQANLANRISPWDFSLTVTNRFHNQFVDNISTVSVLPNTKQQLTSKYKDDTKLNNRNKYLYYHNQTCDLHHILVSRLPSHDTLSHDTLSHDYRLTTFRLAIHKTKSEDSLQGSIFTIVNRQFFISETNPRIVY